MVEATNQDFIDVFNSIKNHNENSPRYMVVLTESEYDILFLKFGEGCGYDVKKVRVYRGYPKFNVLDNE